MAKKGVVVYTAIDYLSGSAPGWIPFHSQFAGALRRQIPDRNDHPKSNVAALFVASCLRWTGKSTRLQGGWFDKTDAQWMDELNCSYRWLRWVYGFVCASPDAVQPRGLGLVNRITEGRDNAAKYCINTDRLERFWLVAGTQPVLQVGLSTGELTGSSTGELTGSFTGESLQKNIQKNPSNVCVDALSAFLISHSIWANKAYELAAKLAAAGIGLDAVETEIKRVYAHSVARTDSAAPVRNVPVFLVQAIESLISV
jgi:hypothetical protein